MQLLTNFEAKIKAEGMDAHNVHEEVTAWCNTQSSDLTFLVRDRANLVLLGEILHTKVDNYRHHREGDGRSSFDDAVERHRRTQRDGTGIVGPILSTSPNSRMV